jgi:TRAP transporter TAXI family solute receptor
MQRQVLNIVLIFSLLLVFSFSTLHDAQADVDWKPSFKYMKIYGTVAPSSWYTWAVNMGLELEKKYPGLKCSAIEGQSGANISATERDYTSFGLTFSNTLSDALAGDSLFKGKSYPNLRYVGIFANQWLNVIIRKGVSVDDNQFTRDIIKLRFSIGAKKWGSTYLTIKGLEALGINEEVVRKAGGLVEYIEYKGMTTMLQDRNLDAAIVWQTMPSMIFQPVASSKPGCYMPQLTKDELQKFILGQPKRIQEILFFGKIPDNYLEGGRKGGSTIGFTAPIIVHKDLPDEMVYEITKIAFESKKVRECCGPIIDCLKSEDPLRGKPKEIATHPGAVKYWKERGLIK